VNPMREVVEYAERHGFVLIRQKKHYVIRNGTHTLSISKTPRCPRAAYNALRDINRVLKEIANDSTD